MIEYLIPNPVPDSKKGSFNYYEPDGEEVFKKNKLIYGEAWSDYWNTYPVTYDLNSLGYRMKEITEINQKNYVVVLGCSHTFGLGLPLEETWSYKLSKHLQCDLVNGAAPGSSNELILINLIRILANLEKPKLVVINWTQVHRKLFWDGDSLVFHLPQCYIGRDRTTYKNVKNWFTELKWENSYNDYLYNEREVYSAFYELKNQVTSICKLYGVPLQMLSHFKGYDDYQDILKISETDSFNVRDRARDIDHFGIKFQNQVVRSLIKTVKNV